MIPGGGGLLLDIPKAANELSVSVSTLRRAIADGDIECVRLRRRVLLRREALVAFIDRATQTGPAPPKRRLGDVIPTTSAAG
jgi:excisionase family DNA binding protein